MTRSVAGRSARHTASMMDVAAHAKVSQKTVSRVVNGEPYVREELRLRVLASIRELGYRPNAAARSLVTRRTRRIGVVTLGTTLHGPASSLAALEAVARSDGYTLSVRRTESTDRAEVQSAVDMLLDEGIEGIVLSESMRLEGAPLAVPADVVVLTLGGRGLTAREDELVVGVDEESGGRRATEHLLSLGHATVHHIGGPCAWVSSELRREGWESALRDHSAEIPEPVVGDWSPRSGFEAMQQLLSTDHRPTAIFAANDQMAIGALSALASHGLSAPEHMSVVGFDDIDIAEYLPTPLTTLRQEFAYAARRGMGAIIQSIDGAPPMETILKVPLSFRERSTTGSPPTPSLTRPS